VDVATEIRHTQGKALMFHTSFHAVAQRFWFSILLLVLLANCSSSTTTIPTISNTAPTSEARETITLPAPTPVLTSTVAQKDVSIVLQWLEKRPCQAPCWEQLTPGMSKLADADARLSQLQYIDNLQKQPEYNQNPGIIAWRWKHHAQSGGSIEYYTKKPPFANPPLDVILRINLGMDRPLTFQEVIAAYGEPSHILLAAEHNVHLGLIYHFSVVYLDQGFLLEPYASDYRRKPVVSADTAFGIVSMFPPGAQGFDAAVEPLFPIRQPSQFLVMWEGFSIDMNVYCREMRADAPEKGCE
jgi:hypothetical protein